MKKVLRILLICFGVVALLVVAALILAFQPSVQTWAARKAVASGAPAGMEISIGRVAAGLNRTEVSGIRVRQPGMTLDLPSATVDVSLMGLLKNRVDIKNLVAKGWTVDLSQPAPAPVVSSTTTTGVASNAPAVSASAKQEPFAGIFDLVKLPIDLTVAAVDVDGTIILPPQEAGAQPARATVAVRGGQLAPGSDAKFDITGAATMPGANAPVSNVTVQGALTARMDTPRTFQAVGFDVEAGATGAQFPQGARIRAQVAAQRGATGESYAVTLKSTGAGTEKNLVSLQASNPTGGKGLDATWAVDLRDADLAPFIMGLGLKLPEYAANGQGTVSADGEFQTIHATGKLTADVNKLETLQAELGTLGRVSFVTNFDVVREGDVVRVSALNADVSSNSTPVASVKSLQLIEANTATGALKVPDLNADLVQVDIAGVPLEWARPFIKDTGFAITGGPLRGSITGRASNGGFSLHSVAPMTLANLGVAQQQPNQPGQPPAPLIRSVDVSTNFAADYTPAGWNATISDLSLQSLGTPLLTLNAKAASPAAQTGQPPPAISATGALRANLAALMAQPAAADFKLLSSGAADVDFTAKVASDVQQIQAKLALSNLQANDKTAMPDVTADLRADVHSNGEINVQAPLVFTLNSRKSDVNLAATLKPDGARQNIDATIQSSEIYIEDLQKFAALAPASPAPAPAQTPAPAATAPAQPDTKPAWDAITGQVKLDIKKIVYSPDMQAGNVTGSVKITPSLLSLENFRAATTDGAEAKISGTVSFDNTAASAAQPYNTDARLAVTNFDPAPILTAANPGKKPTVEGKFDITGAVTGKSATLASLADTAAADLTLTSRGGKFNGFATSAVGANLGEIQKIASAATSSGLVGGLLSMVGGKVGVDTTAAVEKAKAVTSMLGRLIEINFDQLSIDASYNPGKETVIKNFSILSPDMRLVRNGTLGNDSKLSWMKQAITLVASMSVRGDQASDMRTLGLLKTEADSLGFTPLVESFPIQGTVASLTTDALIKQLTSRVPGLGALK